MRLSFRTFTRILYSFKMIRVVIIFVFDLRSVNKRQKCKNVLLIHSVYKNHVHDLRKQALMSRPV